MYDHRIRLRIADIKNITNAEVQLNPFDASQNIYCQIMIREKIPLNEQGNAPFQSSIRRTSNIGVINRFQRRRSSGISERKSIDTKRPSLVNRKILGMQNEIVNPLVLEKRGSIISNVGTAYFSRQSSFQDHHSNDSKKSSFSNIIETNDKTVVTSGSFVGLPNTNRKGSIRLSADAQLILGSLNPISTGKRQNSSYRRSSVGQFMKGSNQSSSSLFISSRIEIALSGSLVNEYELELNSHFHSVLCI